MVLNAEYGFGLAQQSVMGSLKWQHSIWFVKDGVQVSLFVCTAWLRWEHACGSWLGGLDRSYVL